MDSPYPAFANQGELDRAFDRIMRAVLAHQADFLFGAGMSAESGVPAGHALGLELLKRFFPPSGVNPPTDERRSNLASCVPLEVLAQAIENSPGKKREDLTKDLLDIYVNKTHTISQAHKDFLSVSYWDGTSRLDRVFTTNFDPLLDAAFGDRGLRITEDNTRSISVAQREGRVPILYLHGTLESGKYQLTESDLFVSGFKSLQAYFQSALNESDAFVFVGYSMNDPDFRGIYMAFREQIALRQKAEKSTFIVSPTMDTFSHDLLQNVWKSRGAVWLPMTAGAFFQRLRTLLQNESHATNQKAIMEKYQLGDPKAYDDKVAQTADILRVDPAEAIAFLLAARNKRGGAA